MLYVTVSNNAVRPVICEVSILLTCGKHLHDRIKSLRGKSWAHKTSLTPRLFIEACEPSQESDLSCICVGVSMLSLSIGFWKCSDSVVFFVFHFIPKM